MAKKKSLRIPSPLIGRGRVYYPKNDWNINKANNTPIAILNIPGAIIPIIINTIIHSIIIYPPYFIE